jgi:hypothetical protein
VQLTIKVVEKNNMAYTAYIGGVLWRIISYII